MAKQAEKRPRSIFEEVGTTQKSVATPGGIDRGRAEARRGLRIWLGLLFALVVAIVFVGRFVIGFRCPGYPRLPVKLTLYLRDSFFCLLDSLLRFFPP